MLNYKKKYKKYLKKENYKVHKRKTLRYRNYSAKKNLTIFQTIILTLNIIFLFMNICLFLTRFHKKQKNYKKNIITISFKNSEYFSLKFLNKTYQYISAYFHSKYNIDNKMNFKENNSTEKKVIKLKLTGFLNSHLPWLTEKLKDNFILEINSPNPDYLIYNVYDQEDLTEKYRNTDAIRIIKRNYFLVYHLNFLLKYN